MRLYRRRNVANMMSDIYRPANPIKVVFYGRYISDYSDSVGGHAPIISGGNWVSGSWLGPYSGTQGVRYNGTDFVFPGDFTVQCEIYVGNPGGGSMPFVIGYLGTAPASLSFTTTSTPRLTLNVGSGITVTSGSSTIDVAYNSTIKVALVRSANTWKFFIDGVLRCTATENGGVHAIGQGTNRLDLIYGASSGGPAIREARIINGIALFNSNYTPTGYPYPTI